jgi:glycosyltransferase involved in cell wall biosynthesis
MFNFLHSAMTTPLVSCIMPTFDRRAFVARSLEYFRRQDWPALELIIVDDGTQPIVDLTVTDPRIRYHRLKQRQTIGAKRNLACELARGELICHWDDDDWYPRTRVGRQVDALERAGADVCGSSHLSYWDPRSGGAWQYRYTGIGSLPVGNSLLYRTSAWSRTRFADIQIGEDNRFIREVGGPVHDLRDPTLVVGIIHTGPAGNTGPKRTNGRSWTPVPGADIHALLGSDVCLYQPEPLRAQAQH